MTKYEREALDRHITGNWGEDSVSVPECPGCGQTLTQEYLEKGVCNNCEQEIVERWTERRSHP